MAKLELAVLIVLVLLLCGCPSVDTRDAVVIQQPQFIFLDDGGTQVTLGGKVTILKARHMVLENEHWRITCERKDNGSDNRAMDKD